MTDGSKDLNNTQLLKIAFDEVVRQYDLGLEYFLRFLLLTLAIVSLSIGFLVNLSLEPFLFYTICFFNLSIMAVWFIPAGYSLKFERQMRAQLDLLVAQLALPVTKGVYSMFRIVIIVSVIGDLLCIALFGYFLLNHEQFLDRSDPKIYRLRSLGRVHVSVSSGALALADLKDVFAATTDAAMLEYSVIGNKPGIQLSVQRDTLFLQASDTTEWARTFFVICSSKAGAWAIDTIVVMRKHEQSHSLHRDNRCSTTIGLDTWSVARVELSPNTPHLLAHSFGKGGLRTMLGLGNSVHQSSPSFDGIS